MSTHQATGTAATHALNVRVLRFRRAPHREEPALLAQELIDHGRFEDALELIEIALVREPGDPDLELLRGRALLGAGEVARAQEMLIRAAKASPDWAAPLTWLTRALGETSPRAGAIAVRARALGADDTQVVRLARGHETAARLDARVARFETTPEAEEPVMLARELALGGRKDQAVRVLRTAFERDASDPDTRAALRSIAGEELAPLSSERERTVSVLDLDISVEPLVLAPKVEPLAIAEVSTIDAGVLANEGRERELPSVSVTPVSATDIDSALDAFLARRDATVPYTVEARDTELGAPAVDTTLVGMPAPARVIEPSIAAPKHEAPRVEARPELAHGRIRRLGASGWPRRVLPKPESAATPYVRVLIGDARPHVGRA